MFLIVYISVKLNTERNCSGKSTCPLEVTLELTGFGQCPKASKPFYRNENSTQLQRPLTFSGYRNLTLDTDLPPGMKRSHSFEEIHSSIKTFDWLHSFNARAAKLPNRYFWFARIVLLRRVPLNQRSGLFSYDSQPQLGYYSIVISRQKVINRKRSAVEPGLLMADSPATSQH
ncbi:hypothetical protein J6590_091810 [Homalodisca vitripennis]|nr:hypothetical protein J6590_091810 [Homalodisca vitripennis]